MEKYEGYPRFMGKNDIVILGSFSELERKLHRNEISQEEYDRIFSESRVNGLDKSILPFAVGGSDAATICGFPGAFNTRVLLSRMKIGAVKDTPSEETQELFDDGHYFEPAVRALFTGELRRKGLVAHPEPRQFVNLKWPHCVANVDGIIEQTTYEPDKDGIMVPVKKYGIYEGKMTYSTSGSADFFKKDMIPPHYEAQMRFYMEVLDLDFAYICAVIRYRSSSADLGYSRNVYIRLERDREYGRKIMDMCENFVDEVQSRTVRNKGFDKALMERELEALYDCGDPFKDSFIMPDETVPILQKIEKLEQDITEVKDRAKEFTDRQHELTKEKEKLETMLKAAMKDNVKATLSSPHGKWVFTYEVPEGFSKTVKTTKWLKENHPTVYDELTENFPNNRKFTYKKL